MKKSLWLVGILVLALFIWTRRIPSPPSEAPDLPPPAPAANLWDPGVDYANFPAREGQRASPQPFESYRKTHREPWPKDRVLYLLPLDWPGAGDCPILNALKRWSEIWLQRSVVLLPSLEVAAQGFTRRHRPRLGLDQVLSKDILSYLKERKPGDALGLMALTTWDLYPGEGWNYVFAEASLQDRVSILSLARYHPEGPLAWTARGASGQREGDSSWFRGATPLPDDASLRSDEQVAAVRALKLFGSQMGAMLGLYRCGTWRCTMNWPDSLAALDRRPLGLCPSCLRKVDQALKPDHALRYEQLAAFLKELGLEGEAAWFARRRAAVFPSGE